MLLRLVEDLKTRIVRLDGGQRREHAENTRTGVMVVDAMPVASFQGLFMLCYSEIRKVCESFALPGVAVVAIDVGRKRVAGSLCVAAKPGHANSAIIGRHSMADLFLDSDPSLSLRHLALLVHPLRGWDSPGGGDIHYRVLDLRTRAAFEDEEGRRLEAVAAEGPIFLRCGGYALMFFVTGDPTPWPDAGDSAWECIPERVYLDEQPAEPDRWSRGKRSVINSAAAVAGTSPSAPPLPGVAAGTGPKTPPERGNEPIEKVNGLLERLRPHHKDKGDKDKEKDKAKDDKAKADKERKRRLADALATDGHGASGASRITLVQTARGPSRARIDLLAPEEQAIGRLHLRNGDEVQSIVIGERAAGEGILLGRYDRCDTGGASVFSHHSLSRVHCLVVEVDGILYAVDTASTNGTYLGSRDEEVRIIGMGADRDLVLGDDLVRMSWEPA
jgi:FHA domain-containing protein